MNVRVIKPLNIPKVENESIKITQLNKFENYLVDTDEFTGGDITEVVNYLTEKLKSLGHDGTMKIELTKIIYEVEVEEPLNKLFDNIVDNQK